MERTLKKSLTGRIGLLGLCAAMSVMAPHGANAGGPQYWTPAPMGSMGGNPLMSQLLGGIASQVVTQQMMGQMGMAGQMMGGLGMQMGMANGLMTGALGANLDLGQMLGQMATQVATQMVSQAVNQAISKMMSGGGGGGGGSQQLDSNILTYDPTNLNLVNGISNGINGGTLSTTPSFNTAMLTGQNLGSALAPIAALASGGLNGGTASTTPSLSDAAAAALADGQGGLY